MVAWRGCYLSLLRCLWSRKSASTQNLHCRFLVLHKASCEAPSLAGHGQLFGGQQVGMLVSDWLSRQSRDHQLCSPFYAVSQMEATSFWAGLGGTMPVRKPGGPQCQSLGYLAITWTNLLHKEESGLCLPHPSPPSVLCTGTVLWFSFVTSRLLGQNQEITCVR